MAQSHKLQKLRSTPSPSPHSSMATVSEHARKSDNSEVVAQSHKLSYVRLGRAQERIETADLVESELCVQLLRPVVGVRDEEDAVVPASTRFG